MLYFNDLNQTAADSIERYFGDIIRFIVSFRHSYIILKHPLQNCESLKIYDYSYNDDNHIVIFILRFIDCHPYLSIFLLRVSYNSETFALGNWEVPDNYILWSYAQRVAFMKHTSYVSPAMSVRYLCVLRVCVCFACVCMFVYVCLCTGRCVCLAICHWILDLLSMQKSFLFWSSSLSYKRLSICCKSINWPW